MIVPFLDIVMCHHHTSEVIQSRKYLKVLIDHTPIMLVAQPQLRPSSAANFVFPSFSSFPFSNSLNLPYRNRTNRYFRCSAHKTWIAQIAEEVTSTDVTGSRPQTEEEEGPIELSPSIPPIFADSEEPTPLQTATSLLLTGAITLFLFRSLRRRAKRAKETKFRSSGEKKSLTEEAMESLKSVSINPVNDKSPPSPVQAFLGALTAGVIALILYKFTTTIEAALNRQNMPDNYQVRQITITIRTIINGLCYLATFVFGINSLGLLFYSGQLAFNSLTDDSISKNEVPVNSSNSKPDKSDSSANVENTSSIENQSKDNAQ